MNHWSLYGTAIALVLSLAPSVVHTRVSKSTLPSWQPACGGPLSRPRGATRHRPASPSLGLGMLDPLPPGPGRMAPVSNSRRLALMTRPYPRVGRPGSWPRCTVDVSIDTRALGVTLALARTSTCAAGSRSMCIEYDIGMKWAQWALQKTHIRIYTDRYKVVTVQHAAAHANAQVPGPRTHSSSTPTAQLRCN